MSRLRTETVSERREVELRELCRLRSGYSFKSTSWQRSGIPVVQIGNVNDGFLDTSSMKYVDEATANLAERFRLEEGDVILAMTGYVGATTRVKAREAGFLLNQRVGRIESIDPTQTVPDYLYWALRNPRSKAAMVNLARGSAQPNLSAQDFGKITIPLPPLDEQQRIAEVLGALDDLIDTNERLREGYRQLALATTIRASGDSQESLPLGACVTKTVGGVWGEDTEFRDAKCALAIRGIDLASLRRFESAVPPMRFLTAAQLNSRMLQGNELIFETSGTNCGRSWVTMREQLSNLERPVVFSNFCKRFLVNSEHVGPRFLHHFLYAEYEAGRIHEFRTGSAMPNLDMTALLGQVRIPTGQSVRDSEHLLLELDSSAVELESENAQLRRTRDELLPLLMSGAVRVRPEVVAA